MAELSKDYQNNTIELDVKINDKELNDMMEKLNTINDLFPKICIQKIENLNFTINNFKDET